MLIPSFWNRPTCQLSLVHRSNARIEQPLKRRSGLAHHPQSASRVAHFPHKTFRKNRAKTLVEEPAHRAYVLAPLTRTGDGLRSNHHERSHSFVRKGTRTEISKRDEAGFRNWKRKRREVLQTPRRLQHVRPQRADKEQVYHASNNYETQKKRKCGRADGCRIL